MTPCTVLFVCTGNYYRSRYAEQLFNALAGAAGLGWRAESRGLTAAEPNGNVGPIAVEVVQALAQQGVTPEASPRYPQQLYEADLRRADLVVGLNEAEHRPLMQARFPGWAAQARYWRVLDLHEAPVSQALPEAEREVRALVKELLDRKG